MFNNNLEEWEQAHVNSLTLKMIFLATGGTLLATAIAYVLKKSALGEIQPELLFVPWGIVLVLGISTAFKKGVIAERGRQKSLKAAAPAASTTPATAKKTTRKTKRKKAVRKKVAATKTATADKKPAVKKSAPKKAAKKKSVAKKTTAKAPAAKKPVARKAKAKKTTTKKKAPAAKK